MLRQAGDDGADLADPDAAKTNAVRAHAITSRDGGLLPHRQSARKNRYWQRLQT